MDGSSVSRRDFLKLAGAAGAAIGLGLGLGGLAACGDETTTTTTAGGTATTAGGTTTTAGGTVTTSASAAGDQLKLGMILDYSFPLHVMWQHQMEALIPDLNTNGGLKVGDKSYQVDVIMYDGKRDSETSRSAVQRLLNEDKVAFIMGDESTDYWQPLTEAAGTLVVSVSPSPEILKPVNKLTFQAGYLNLQPAVIWGWCTEKYPNIKKVMASHPDNLQGNEEANKVVALTKAWGQTVTKEVLYPGGTTDFSAIATTLVDSGGEAFSTCAGGPVSDGQLHKAMREAGFTGSRWITVGFSPGSSTMVVPMENFEGVTSCWAQQDLPNPPAEAAHLKEVYTASMGKWDYPAVLHVNSWYLLKAALQKAGTLDANAIADLIHKGMDFESAYGFGRMVPRPDLNNPLAVDALWGATMGIVENLEWKVVDEVSLDQAYDYNKKTFGW